MKAFNDDLLITMSGLSSGFAMVYVPSINFRYMINCGQRCTYTSLFSQHFTALFIKGFFLLQPRQSTPIHPCYTMPHLTLAETLEAAKLSNHYIVEVIDI